ncbi:MAG: hypothetical protein AAF066_06425 [Pseudomonadota bacterium]
MIHLRTMLFAASLAMFPATNVFANAQSISCRLLDVMSQNKVSEVEGAVSEFSNRWLAESREGAIKQLTSLLEPLPFVGGSLHRIAKLGEDFEEHVMLLRLREGEVAAMRLRYEWSPGGPALTGIDFKRKIADLSTVSFIGVPEEITCP